jgi:hypothetical protein
MSFRNGDEALRGLGIKPLNRRAFLGRSLAAVAGVMFAYVRPSVRTVSADAGFDAAIAVIGARLPTFPFSQSGEKSLAVLGSVADAWKAQAAAGLTDNQLKKVWTSGWQLAAEVNPDGELHEAINTAIGLPVSKSWAPQLSAKRSDYKTPTTDMVRSELVAFETDHPVTDIAGIIIVILIVILVCDCPEPAK